MRYVWLALVLAPLLACAKTAIWDDPGWENPVEVVIETSSDGQSWTVAGCQPDGQTLSLTVPDANYYRSRAIERGPAATGDCDIANAERVSEYSNVFADAAELLPYSDVSVAPVLPWAIPGDPEPLMPTFTLLTSGTVTSEPVVTASVSPAANALLIVVAASANSGADVFLAHTVSGLSASWTVQANQIYGFRRALSVATVLTGDSPVSGTITIDFSNTVGSYQETKYAVVQVTGIDTDDAIGTVYSGNESDASDTDFSIAIGETPGDGDMVFAAFGIEGASVSATLNSELDNTLINSGGGANVRTLVVAYDSAPDSNPNPGVTWSPNHTHGGVAFIVHAGAGSGTDDLTGDDLVAGTPTLDTPALGQTHVLSGSDLSASAPVLDTPALGQVHALSATDLAAGAPTLGTPALSEVTALTGDDLTAGTPALDSPAIGQVHALSGTDLSAGTPALDSPALGQTHALSATDLTAGTPTLGTPTLAEGSHALTANDLVAGTPVLDTPAIGQAHALSATGLVSGTPALDSPSIGQIHALTGSDLAAGTPTLDTPALSEGNHVLTGDDLIAGAPTLDTPAFAQVHALTGSDLAAGNPLLDSPVIGQIHALSATDLAAGAPVLDTPVFSEATALTANDLTAGTPTLDAPTITQIHVLIPDDLITGAPTLTGAELGQIHGLIGNDLVAGTPVLDTPALGEAGGFLIYTATVGTSTGAGASASGSSGWRAQ